MGNLMTVEEHRALALGWGGFLSHNRDEQKREVEARMKWLETRCESPIEAIFAWYFTAFSVYQPFNNDQLVLEAQHWFEDRDFGRYRFDFAVKHRTRGLLNIAIELDGHGFHERTPEQVEHRNKRDQRMQLHGWKMLHYSGRQVHRDQMSCAAQAWLVAHQRASRWGWL